MWRQLSILLVSWFSVLHGCIPTESPDDRPDIPGVFTTTTISIIPTTTTTPTTTSTTTTTTTTTTTSLVCPANYHLFTDPNLLTSACYYVSPSATRFTWNDARAACMADGGDLAAIRSPEENNFVLMLAQMEPPPFITDPFVHGVPWIGVSCTTGCGGGLAWIMANYMYVDGTPLVYSPWYTGPAIAQPDASPSCALLITANSAYFGPAGIGLWHDLACTDQSNYACQVPVMTVG